MDKYVVSGAKKLLSLTKTKIRLAREADTLECIPAPLPLVKYLFDMSVSTIDSAAEHREKLLKEIDYASEESIASTVLACMDIIEGVKHKFEPKEYCFNLSQKDLEGIEKEAREKKQKINVLIMSKKTREGINLYFGEKTDLPKDALYVSGVPTSLAALIYFMLNSGYFSKNKRLENITCVLGNKTLINNAISYSLSALGADL